MIKHCLFFLSLAVFCLSQPLHAEEGQYSGGEGTEDNPYSIATAQDWAALSKAPHHWSLHFTLANDIDFKNANLKPIGADPQKSPFTGFFDGKGHTLQNVKINSNDKSGTGLFGEVGEGGTIKNLSLEDFSVKGQDNVGALVGNLQKGTVENCSSNGEVSGRMNVGGLIGRQELATITECSSSGKVTGISAVTGGLIGLSGGSSWTSGGTISHCQSAADVEGTRYVGGFIGSLQDGSVSQCSATGKIKGDNHVGGFAGASKANITASFATGQVNSDGASTGGVVGASGATINQCFATGKVSGERSTGGLVGTASGKIVNCYATGDAESSQDYTGALVGQLVKGSVENCYAIGNVKGNLHSQGLAGKGEEKDIRFSYWLAEGDAGADKNARTEEELTRAQSENTFEKWDFNQIWTRDKDKKVNQGYPWLKNIQQ